jgi:hypothetical protein
LENLKANRIVPFVSCCPDIVCKERMHAESEIVMNKPMADVFNYLKYLKNQNDYSKWGGKDPAMKSLFATLTAPPVLYRP